MKSSGLLDDGSLVVIGSFLSGAGSELSGLWNASGVPGVFINNE